MKKVEAYSPDITVICFITTAILFSFEILVLCMRCPSCLITPLFCSSSVGDPGPHVGRELQDHDGGRAANRPSGSGQSARQVSLRLQPRLVARGDH